MVPDTRGAVWRWRKSSRSGGESGNCVELGFAAGQAGIRDSKFTAGPVLAMRQDSLVALVAATKAGLFDG